MTEQQEEGGMWGRKDVETEEERGRQGGEVLNSTEDYYGILPRERSCCYS